MIVLLDKDSRCAIRDASDFQRFKVVCHTSAAATAGPNPNIDFTDDGHAWVSIALLRQYGREYQSPEWLSKLEVMLAYAASKGWLDVPNARIRAHVEHLK